MKYGVLFYIVLMLTNMTQAEDIQYDWTIVGTASSDNGKLIDLAGARILVAMQYNDEQPRMLELQTKPKLNAIEKSAFTIHLKGKIFSPKEGGYEKSVLFIYVWMPDYCGRSEPIVFDTFSGKAEVRVKLADCKNALKLKLLEFESGKPVANQPLKLFWVCFDDAMRERLEVAQGKTDPDGVCLFAKLPAGKFGVSPTGDWNEKSQEVLDRQVKWNQAVVYEIDPRRARERIAMLKSSDTEDQKIIPVYVMPRGKSVFYDEIQNHTDPDEELIFHAYRSSDPKSELWDPKLEFSVKVNDAGRVATPLIPRGVYRVTTQNGEVVQTIKVWR